MASRRSTLLAKEFECPICMEELNKPKIVGFCQHTVCYNCLQSYLTQYKGKSKFPCPICRQEYPLPKKGTGSFKNNFTLANIIRICKETRHIVTELLCGVCESEASHFCLECQSLYLCHRCAKAHGMNSKTRSHVVMGVCPSHGKILDDYCKTCNKVICSACLIASHHDDQHVIQSHREVVAQTKEDISKMASEVRALLEKLNEQEEELTDIDGAVSEKVETVLSEVSSRALDAVSSAETEMEETDEIVQELNKKIAELEKERDAVMEKYNASQERRDVVLEEKVELGWQLRRFSDKCTEGMRGTISEISCLRGRLNSALQDWESAKSENMFDGSSQKALTKLHVELSSLSEKVTSSDFVSQFNDIVISFPRFVPNSDQRCIGCLRHEYSSAEKTADLSFPCNGKCEAVQTVLYLADGRVASLGRIDTLFQTNMLYFWRLPSFDVSHMITGGVFPAVDVSATSVGVLAVLRRNEPIVRVFNVDTGLTWSVDLKLDQPQISTLVAIETDNRGHCFIIYGESSQRHLLATTETGAVVQDLEIDGALQMSYCWVSNTLFVTTEKELLQYRWASIEPRLQQTSAVVYGTDDFSCVDVCTARTGSEVFVAGVTGSDLRLFQVLDPVCEGRLVNMAEIEMSESISSGDFCSFCVKEDQMMLGWKDKISVFKLVP